MTERKSDFDDPFMDDPWGCFNGCLIYGVMSVVIGIVLTAWCGA
jgi:hypothetical protein